MRFRRLLKNLISRTDAIYTITDNLVANSIQLVVEKTREMGVVTMGAERAHVESGILITDGIDYRELGRQTARMAIRILKKKPILPKWRWKRLTILNSSSIR